MKPTPGAPTQPHDHHRSRSRRERATTAHRISPELRRAGTSYAELARRTAQGGYPLAVHALQNIEAQRRRVDVDDLVVLATVFGVPPADLLRPLTVTASISIS